MTPKQRKAEFIRGVKAALREVKRKLPMKSEKAINDFADMAGLSHGDTYFAAAFEVQKDIKGRVAALIPAKSKEKP